MWRWIQEKTGFRSESIESLCFILPAWSLSKAKLLPPSELGSFR